VIGSLRVQGCDSVALCCTEIPLLITPDVSPLPTLDSTRLLALEAVTVGWVRRRCRPGAAGPWRTSVCRAALGLLNGGLRCMRIAVMGTEGVGGYSGGRLAAAGHDVTFIARGAQLEALRTRGLRIESPKGDLTLPSVRATGDPAELGPVEALTSEDLHLA
jgi:hypothetical protein